MELFDYMLGFEQGKKSGGGGGGSAIAYTSIVDNGDNTITAIDKDGTEHTIAYTFDDGKIISVSLDGKSQTVIYDENGVLTSIGNTDVNVETVPVTAEPQGEIEITENGNYDVSQYATANIDVMLYVDENAEVE